MILKVLQLVRQRWTFMICLLQRLLKNCGKKKGEVDGLEAIALFSPLLNKRIPYGVCTLCCLLL